MRMGVGIFVLLSSVLSAQTRGGGVVHPQEPVFLASREVWAVS